MPSSTRRTLTAAAVALSALAAIPAAASASTTTVPNSVSLTCRGHGVDPDAKIRYQTETVIHAPLETVWDIQTDVADWPAWQPPVTTSVRLDHGALRPGSAFRWTTPVPATAVTPATTLTITSTVQQMKHGSCIRWTGPAVGGGILINGVHVWNFTKIPDGVLVTTEETHTGPQVDADVPLATELLSTGLDAWLSELKTTAEARAHR